VYGVVGVLGAVLGASLAAASSATRAESAWQAKRLDTADPGPQADAEPGFPVHATVTVNRTGELNLGIEAAGSGSTVVRESTFVLARADGEVVADARRPTTPVDISMSARAADQIMNVSGVGSGYFALVGSTDVETQDGTRMLVPTVSYFHVADSGVWTEIDQVEFYLESGANIGRMER
jgi:hypothetical protein